MMYVWHRVDEWLVRLSWLPSLVLMCALILIVIQAADRKEPFHVLSVEPASARPGERVTIRAKVVRDTSRNCSATMARSVFDAAEVRFDYPLHKVPDAVIDQMEKATPGQLAISIMIPHGAASGVAQLVSALEYRCNRVHAIWPIEVVTVMPFTVLE